MFFKLNIFHFTRYTIASMQNYPRNHITVLFCYNIIAQRAGNILTFIYILYTLLSYGYV